MHHVLLVDDMPTQRFLLASLLSHCDCTVTTASGGEEALALANEKKPDVVLLDLSMPEMDGYQLAERLRKDAGLTDAKLVAVSAWDCDVARLSEAGIDEYLRKPVMLQKLKSAITL
jgi:two-component system capsular synthesis sensor histidine kinase RcsC